MTTRATLELRALRVVGVIDAFNGPNPTLSAEAATVLTALHEAWIDDGMVKWELSDIPTRADKPTVDLLAYELTNYHPVDQFRENKLALNALAAEKALYRQVEVPYNGESVEVEYF